MTKAVKIKDIKVGMLWQPFSWKPFIPVKSICASWDDTCVCINDTFHMNKESYTYVKEVTDEKVSCT